MAAQVRFEVEGGQPAVLDDDAAVDDRPVDPRRVTEDDGRQRVVPRPGVLHLIEVDGDEVGAHAGGQLRCV